MPDFVRGPALEGSAIGSGSFAVPAEIRPLPALEGAVWLSPDASLLPFTPGTAFPISGRPLVVGPDGVVVSPGNASGPINLGGLPPGFDPADYQPMPLPTPGPTGLRITETDTFTLAPADAAGAWSGEAVTFAFGGWLIL